MSRASSVLLTALASGVLGWAGESLLFGPRYSGVFGGAKVPFLPVYAVGGATVALLAPHLANQPALVRAAAYGATLTALEAAAGYAERAEGRMSWDYDGSPVDLKHALLWAGLGLVFEQVLPKGAVTPALKSR